MGLLKYYVQSDDKTIKDIVSPINTLKEVEIMGDKKDAKKKKKLTKKELKAINHQKLMEDRKSTNGNVIEVNFSKDKKAA